MSQPTLLTLVGDAEKQLATLPAALARCCVTSPPYWGLRDYGFDGQIGLEATPEEWIDRLVAVFAQVHRVLTADGTLWVNLGDAYSTGTTAKRKASKTASHGGWTDAALDRRVNAKGIGAKNLIGQPWMLAFALRAAGWNLRQEIIWFKNNPMPESAKDRPTRTHEHIFLFSKSPRYYYDHKAIKEPCSENTHARRPKVAGHQHGKTGKQHSTVDHNRDRTVGVGYNARPTKGCPNGLNPKAAAIDAGNHKGPRPKQNDSMSAALGEIVKTRNSRSVWKFPTQAYKGGHYATFPEELPRRCILAGSAPGDVVLDPFGGTFTTAVAAILMGRKAVMVEGNPKYAEQGRERCLKACGVFIQDHS